MKLQFQNKEHRAGKREALLSNLRDAISLAMSKKDYVSARKSIRKLEHYSKMEAMEQTVILEVGRGNIKAAEKEYRKLCSIAREKTPYHLFLEAKILYQQDRVIEALQVLHQANIPNEEYDAPHLDQFYNLLGQCHKFLGNNKEAIEAYLFACKKTHVIETAIVAYSSYLFNLHYIPVSISEQREAAKKFQTIFNHVKQFSHPVPAQKKTKIRVGYISPDLRKHVVLRFSYVFFAKYDHERFEVFLYANNLEDNFSRHLAKIVDCWRNVSGHSMEEIAKLIYADKIDILMDLAGHTAGSCISSLAYKPAPIQISGIGYWASTGLKTVDYFLGDKYLDTEEAKQGFTEELLVLPDSHFCYAEVVDVPPIGELPCKRNGYVTFGCFNNFSKMNHGVLQAWAKILQQLPDARLLLKARIFNREENRAFAMHRMEQDGIPLDRVDVRRFDLRYMDEYNDMDIALDTFPYPGGTTTCDALYMSVPMITLRGKSHGERFGSSILENMGLGELCANTVEEYIEKAVALAQDRERLDTFHQTVKETLRESPVMNADLYMKNVQSAYEAIWNRYIGQHS